MATATLPAQKQQVQQVLLRLDWDRYCRVEELVEQPGLRITYSRGNLELMTLSYLHESLKSYLGMFLVVLSDVFDQTRMSGGSTTFRRADLDRGLEPDQCYYLENEPLMRGKEELDLSVDPPPDLVIEIEVSRSLLDRIEILEAIGVPEIWCTDGEAMRFLVLNDSGKYDEVKTSRAFPQVTPADLLRFLKQRKTLDERSLVNAFREWAESQLS